MAPRVTIRPTAKSGHFLLLVAGCILAFGATRRPELILFCLPFVVAIAIGLAGVRIPTVSVRSFATSHAVFEDDRIEVTLQVDAKSAVTLLELLVPLPEDIRLVEGSNLILTTMTAGERREFRCAFTVPTRRVLAMPPPQIRMLDAHGFWNVELAVGEARSIIVYPRPESIRLLISPEQTQVFTGNFAARDFGEGVEFATVREMQRGDRLSSVNWRLTANRGSLFVNQFVPERNADIVMFIDAFEDFGSAAPSVMDRATRCAAAISHHYLRAKNRVGMIEFGYFLNMLRPATGTRQWYRILTALASTEALPRQVSYRVSALPQRILPSHSLVIACTALLSDRFDEALFDLKHRGFDVVAILIELESEADTEQSTDESIRSIAIDLWRFELKARVTKFKRSGIPVAYWGIGLPVESVLREIAASRGFRR